MTDLYVKGPVISPGWIGRPELGKTDRPLTAAEIQKAAYAFPIGSPLLDIQQPVVDVQHDFQPQAVAVEQFIAPEPINFNNYTYEVGTWFLTSKVTDPLIQKRILSGELTGYSVGAFPEDYKTMLMAKGMFSDVPEGGWFPLAVSMVKMPFYPQAVFKVFGPEDIIKKSFNSEVDNVSDENNAIAAMFGKLLDYVIKKEGSDEDKYESELEKKVRKLKESREEDQEEIKKLRKKVDKLSDKDEEPPGKESDEEEEEDKEEDKKDKKKDKPKKDKKENKKDKKEKDEEQDEDEEIEGDKEEKIIKKGLDIDDDKGKSHKSFMDNIGCDSMGRNKKYL